MINKYAPFIKALRTKRGLSQAELAIKLGMSRPSYIAIEQGKRELTIGEFEKLPGILGVSREELEGGETPDYEKYKQMILAFLRMGGRMTKTKLAKLLYFADFGWFYYHLESMSGMQYRKIQYGPVADSYFRIIDEMFDGGEIDITQTKEGAMLISQTRSGAKIDLTKINKEEKVLVEKIGEKWKDKKTSEIVDFTHKQFPYLFANDNDIVSYDVFTQENPDEVF
ncbi:MAG: Helix-turn-helix domain protein [candidate division CPR1 bacterium GW2011_GWA2_42_17]|uniref:Helix-turn-helix domain protein n=1 Tax=candidate division CPR1 bacterium GW2011_GWA2_42_17 TaxID=1618341 RepID=A0A0G1C353_9BACT|nr:MAG: Helix-turn-helix domain protein [candidate division CPR1 bacterium GW2011_GWA2_42_17]